MLQVHEELRRLRGGAVPFRAGEYDEIVARVRPIPEKSFDFGVGAECTPGSGSFRSPSCYKYDTPVCEMATVPGSLLGQAGQTTFTVQLEPIRSPYFEALACRMTIRDGANEELQRSIRLTGVYCNGGVRDTYDTRTPTAATTNYVLSDQYEVPDPYAVPVPWGVFGKINNREQLDLVFWSEHAAAVTVDANVVVKGVALPPNHARVLDQITGSASSA